MSDLDLALRTPGSVVLLEPRRAAALAERALTSVRPSHGVLSRALGAIGLSPHAEQREERPNTLAMPSVPWAEGIEFADGYCIINGVAVIEIEGVLTPNGYYDWWSERWVAGYLQIGATARAARADDRVRALFARVNSPGGMTSGCFDLVSELAAGNATNGGKPFWVHASLVCSAAYALACAADRILAPADGDVGSIGVYIMHVDVSEWLAEVGIKIEAIQSHPNKTDGADWKPLSEEAREHLQSVVGEIARRFSLIVQEGRGLSAEQVADLRGRWFLAEHADDAMSGLALGLIDEIATERQAFDLLVASLPDLDESGVPTGTGSIAADSAAHTKAKESEMSLEDEVKKLRAAAARGDKKAIARLNQMGIALKPKAAADDDPDAEQDPDDPNAEDNPDDPDAEDNPDDPEAEADDDPDAEDEDKEPEAKATGARAGSYLVGSKHARGREKLAGQLAAKVGAGKMSYGDARGLLKSAARSSALGAAMSGRDHNPGNDAPNGRVAGLSSAVDRFNAKRAGK
ncbi:S49 family peptidase [uncultured Devosia sp.]|uniref:S49 family peptidase n=1 Tax=uncultured Devosia sp. TaxID=211434 RepID=UPI0026059993|nr:S49 family peptidase [uncultured Devosia sp.]